jgi:hypothetical protein
MLIFVVLYAACLSKKGDLKPISYLLFCEIVYLTGLPDLYNSSFFRTSVVLSKNHHRVFDLRHTKTHAR